MEPFDGNFTSKLELGCPVLLKCRFVSFFSLEGGLYAPAPDALHSGLTNDVMALAVKRDDLGELL